MRQFIFHARPLHIALAGLMLGLVVIFYLSLESVGLYLGGQRDLRAADDKVQRVGRELNGVFDSELLPMKSAIKILAETPLITGNNHTDRLSQLGPMAAALVQNPSAGSMYVGLPNGAFMLMRNLKDRPKDRATFNAPEQALFLVQSINPDEGENTGHFYFYDTALNLIESRDKPDYQFDPRTRPWYEQASQTNTPGEIIQTAPYIFASNQKVGITLAVSSINKAGIVGIDMSLTGLSRLIDSQKITPSAELVLFNASGAVIAYRDAKKIFKQNTDGKSSVVSVPELDVAALSELFKQWNINSANNNKKTNSKMYVDGKEWYFKIEPINGSGKEELFLGIAVPNAELMADSIYINNLSIILSLVLMTLMLPAVFYTSKKISSSLRELVKLAKDIENFDLSGPDPARSSITEVDNLATNMTSMKHTLKRFLDISSALSAESNFNRLINIILRETISVSGAISGALILISSDKKTTQTAALQFHGLEQSIQDTKVYSLNESQNTPLEVQAIVKGCLQSLRISRSNPSDAAIYANIFNVLGIEHAHLVALPLRNRSNEVLGALTLTLKVAIDEKNSDFAKNPISPTLLAFIEALSGTAAIAIDNQKMIADQKNLLESLIELVAGAIDAKSAYSGAHCQRVPELSKMLAKAACDKKEGPFSHFSMKEEDWEALHVASWLHDCGKVTTPEFVVDKATKLETIYDRIHEIRMRFEVLKRDAEITVYKKALAKLAEPGVFDIDTLRAEMAQPLAALDDDFEFIATCNIGGEFMAPEKIERLTAISKQRWLRTINDRLGISYPELLQREAYPLEPLPVWENLLSDKPEHILPRVGRDIIETTNNPWGFKITAPKNLYNRGEVYNLAIARGTLTEEERYKINEHIIQTIKMLSALPFPSHLSRVTEIAGGHHEKMDGTGYPRNLRKEEMSVEARMMAIADVFEALTAVDRPYKKGKTLSESVKIMGFMKKDQHIDPDLFDLFLESGAYLEYAHKFMRPEQIDAVDVALYINK